MRGAHTAAHVAALAAHMPQGESALYAALDPDAGWTRTDILLALLVNHFTMMRYGMADRRSRGPQPKMVGPSWMTRGKMRKLTARTMGVDELMAELRKPRTQARG